MAELTEEQKTLVVTMLAHFRSPTEIIEYFGREENLSLTHRQVIGYDPMSLYFEAGEKWRELHAKARALFVEETSQHSIANQSFRLRELTELYAQAKRKGNVVLAANLMRQAAEEVGGALTNERKVAIERSAKDLEPEERRKLVADLIDGALGRREGQAEGPRTVQ